MARLFISYSSRDRGFVRQLAGDLKGMGHDVWLDEWSILVGECIMTAVEQGVAKAEYVVVVLSSHAVDSGWVEREWKAKYWDEVETGQVRVLPALLENCQIPELLKTKKYADFRDSYAAALDSLAEAIEGLGVSAETVSSAGVNSRHIREASPDRPPAGATRADVSVHLDSYVTSQGQKGWRLRLLNVGSAPAVDIAVSLDGHPIDDIGPVLKDMPTSEMVIGPGNSCTWPLAICRGFRPPWQAEVTWSDESGELGQYRTTLTF